MSLATVSRQLKDAEELSIWGQRVAHTKAGKAMKAQHCSHANHQVQSAHEQPPIILQTTDPDIAHNKYWNLLPQM